MLVIDMDKKKKDYLIVTLGFQFLVCAAFFGICFGLKATDSKIIPLLKDAYFDKLDENFIIEKAHESKAVTDNGNIEKNNVSTTETYETTNTTESTTDTETTLSAEIKPAGGADVSVNSADEIPSNVSVNGYTLNRKMVLPVQGDTSSEFGVRVHPIDGDLRFHAGTDIAAATGTPIYAAYDGIVIKSEYDQWNGNHIKIQHDNSIMTVYCHCDELNVKKGDVVRAGEVIGKVGSTGSSTGPHLHFELRINGVSYDPQSALDDAVSAV